jgi:regulatory protein
VQEQATNKKAKRISDPHLAYLKARNYCAFQERSQQEVRNKLFEWGVPVDSIDDILVKLIDTNFLNEERFAIQYAGGKFRIKKWGKIKIRQGLKLKGVSEYCIKKGLALIDMDDYKQTLNELLTQKSKPIRDNNKLKANYKLANYAVSRGFESDLIWEVLKGEE